MDGIGKGKVFVTGDTHGDYDFAKMQWFCGQNDISKDDFVIIAGDFGGVWNKKSINNDLKPYQKLPITVLFVDGNHENFDLLDAMPVSEWNGGRVHMVKDNIIHLMRGQVYNISGKTFFTFGGAESVDKEWRKEGISWWPQEVPVYWEYEEGYKNLQKHNNKVDYIITHTADEKALFYPSLIKYNYKPVSDTNRGLNYFENQVDYGHWYFGHYHLDAQVTPHKTAIYNEIIRII